MEEKGRTYAHHGLLCLLTLTFSRLTELIKVSHFQADPRCWPEPDQVQGILGHATSMLPVTKTQM